jgi:hypothetical protein
MEMNNRRGQWVGGLFLIGLGLLFLLNQFTDLPGLENVAIYFVLVLGIIFLAWGVLSREAGLMVPGGILTGIGLGIALVAGPFAVASGDRGGGIFMGAFALGWVLITIFTALFTDETMWWPLIPAAIMALVSGGLLVQGPFWVALEWVGKLWPLALILGGIAILFGARGSRGEKEAEQPEIDETAVDKLKTG